VTILLRILHPTDARLDAATGSFGALVHAQPGSASPGLGRALLLGGVLALLVGGGLGHAGRRSVDRDLASGRFHFTPLAAVRAARAYLTNEDGREDARASGHDAGPRP
jgi:hypothetical protein